MTNYWKDNMNMDYPKLIYENRKNYKKKACEKTVKIKGNQGWLCGARYS